MTTTKKPVNRKAALLERFNKAREALGMTAVSNWWKSTDELEKKVLELEAKVPQRPAAAKKSPAQRALPMGQKAAEKGIKPVRDGTIRARILRLLAEGKHTPAAILKKVPEANTESNVTSHIYCLNRDCGIGYEVKEGRVYAAVYAKGKKLEDYIRPPKAA